MVDLILIIKSKFTSVTIFMCTHKNKKIIIFSIRHPKALYSPKSTPCNCQLLCKFPVVLSSRTVAAHTKQYHAVQIAIHHQHLQWRSLEGHHCHQHRNLCRGNRQHKAACWWWANDPCRFFGNSPCWGSEFGFSGVVNFCSLWWENWKIQKLFQRVRQEKMLKN